MWSHIKILAARGFPVDRIIKPEAPPEPDDTEHVTEPVPVAKTDSSHTEGNSSVQGTTPEGSNGSTNKQKQTGEETPEHSLDDYVRVLKQMFPTADEAYIRHRLGDNPSLDNVQALAEEMTMQKEREKMQGDSSVKSAQKKEEPRKSKVFGSKKLGRALSSFGGATLPGMPNRLKNNGGTTAAPPDAGTFNGGRPKSPETDALAHKNMERQLEQGVKQSSQVTSNGIQSEERHTSIPEGLDHGKTCEVIPGQDLIPYVNKTNNKSETHNGIKIFSARKHPASADFLRDNFDCIESFAVILEHIAVSVYGLQLSSVAIYHDPTGNAIAFNSNRALHFNAHYFYALHFSKNDQGSPCYSYWFVTFAHELAHHFVSGHNKDHGFYTESYCTLYLPKLLALLSTLQLSS